MTEVELKTFIDVVINYFEQITSESCSMGIPYTRTNDPIVLEYTGLIGISGSRKGGIYITSKTPMLADLASIMLDLPQSEVDSEIIIDSIGELANTIAGNVRKSFGSSFMISVPIILKGSPDDIIMKLSPPVFIIPILWRDHQAFLSVGLE